MIFLIIIIIINSIIIIILTIFIQIPGAFILALLSCLRPKDYLLADYPESSLTDLHCTALLLHYDCTAMHYTALLLYFDALGCTTLNSILMHYFLPASYLESSALLHIDLHCFVIHWDTLLYFDAQFVLYITHFIVLPFVVVTLQAMDET